MLSLLKTRTPIASSHTLIFQIFSLLSYYFSSTTDISLPPQSFLSFPSYHQKYISLLKIFPPSQTSGIWQNNWSERTISKKTGEKKCSLENCLLQQFGKESIWHNNLQNLKANVLWNDTIQKVVQYINLQKKLYWSWIEKFTQF